LGRSQGDIPFLATRIAPESTVSLGFAIMSVSMFGLARSHNGEGLFGLVGHFASGRAWAADHTITLAVERMKSTINYS
jgi:hypothetical protein